jgi:ribose 5-phosphate isomerase B
MPTTIAIASDHAGFDLKTAIIAHLQKQGQTVKDFGCHSTAPVDYPDFIRPAAEGVAKGECALGIVLGGSGNGEAIVANKVRGIRCGYCFNEESARLTKLHNNANVIAIGARLVPEALALKIVDTWLATEFEGGRHIPRIQKIEGNR